MLIQNIKSSAKDVVTKEEWEKMQKTMVPGASVTFASLYKVLDEDAISKGQIPTSANVPEALKISTNKKNATTEDKKP